MSLDVQNNWSVDIEEWQATVATGPASGGSEDRDVASEGIYQRDEKKTHKEIANAQVDWLLSRGGYFDVEKVAIKPIYETNDDPTSLGIFAVGDIKRGDILMKIPTSMILASST